MTKLLGALCRFVKAKGLNKRILLSKKHYYQKWVSEFTLVKWIESRKKKLTTKPNSKKDADLYLFMRKTNPNRSRP